MGGVAIYHALLDQGRKISKVAGRLVIEPAAGLSESQRSEILQNKTTILDELRQDGEIARLLALGPALWRSDWRAHVSP